MVASKRLPSWLFPCAFGLLLFGTALTKTPVDDIVVGTLLVGVITGAPDEPDHASKGRDELSKRRQIQRGGRGSILIAPDRSGKPCPTCGSSDYVLFIQFNTAERGRVTPLRICCDCVDVTQSESSAIRHELSDQTKEA